MKKLDIVTVGELTNSGGTTPATAADDGIPHAPVYVY